MHLASRKKFCMSTITRAVDEGAIEKNVPSGPTVAGIVSLFGEPPERS